MLARIMWYLNPLSSHQLKKTLSKLEPLWRNFLDPRCISLIDMGKPNEETQLLSFRLSVLIIYGTLTLCFVSSSCASLIRLFLCDDTLQ